MALDIEATIDYPADADEWWLTIAIGGFLLVFGVLVVPFVLVQGYAVRVMRDTCDGVDVPPRFDRWSTLLLNGSKLVVIGIVYGIVPILVIGISTFPAISRPTLDAAALFDLLPGLGIGLIVTGLVGLIFYYVAAAAVVNFAYNRRFRAGFDIHAIRSVITDESFAMAWFASLGVLFVASVINGLLVLTVVGVLLWPFVAFYAYVVVWRLWARGYADARSLSAG